jgi:hypothetical protein
MIILINSYMKHKKIHGLKISVGYYQILMAVGRGYFTFVYNLCAFASRYYLILALPLLFVLPVLSAVLFGMHLLQGIVEYTLKKPQINPLSFLFYLTLEQLAYQNGVWWGCLKTMNFQPVNPHVIRQIK